MLDYEEVRHIGIYAETATGWRVFLHAPLRGVIAELSSDYRLGGLLLVVACAIALLFARAIVRRVSVSVRDMHAAVDSLSVDGGSEVVQVPANTLAEFLPFFDAMGKKSGDLKKAYSRLKNSTQAGEALRRELTQRITLNEVEIAERTEELEEAYASLRSLSKTDALTGIANRRGFDEFEQRAYRHAARKMLPISVILVDIDYFKIYNDSLGHQAGDECLKTVAETLLSCANRPLDLVARYGGEEFVAVLGETEIKNALIVGERMRNRVEQLKIEHPGSSHYVLTVSVGIASVIPTHDSTAESLVKAADDALYYAKAAGRNCVVFREDEKYVTYDGEDFDRGSTTSVLHILKNKPA
jgi:diguanylate cyclase (GGDEF)-like protein